MPIFGDIPGWYYNALQRFKVGVYSLALGNSEDGPLIEASGSSVKVPSPLIIGSTSLTGAELGLVDGVTAGTPAASKALTLDANSQIGAYQTSDGVGAKNGAAVAVAEYGSGAVHKSVFTLTSLSITMTDAGAAGCHGSHKIYDFPAGVIQILGCSYDLTTLAGAGGIADGAALVGALGSAATATDNATLTSTEADLIASTTGTLTAGAGALAKHGSMVTTAFDGHTTAMDAYLNVAVPDADSSASDTVAVSGTITIVWANLGDY